MAHWSQTKTPCGYRGRRGGTGEDESAGRILEIVREIQHVVLRERESRDGARECINEGEKRRGNEARRSMKGGKQKKKQGLYSGVLFYRSAKEGKSETLHPRESCNPIRANEISFECQKVREIVVRWGEEVAWMSRSGFPGRTLVKGGPTPQWVTLFTPSFTPPLVSSLNQIHSAALSANPPDAGWETLSLAPLSVCVCVCVCVCETQCQMLWTNRTKSLKLTAPSVSFILIIQVKESHF